MIGIWGVGGGGKTTLATSVYMEIKNRFQGHCIVDNIREESSKHSLPTLQEKLLSAVLKTQVGVQNEEEGKHIIKNRLCRSNVLILLDDVDDHKQLEALAGSHSWFGYGSRIIITTRNEHLLQKVDYVSPVRLLSGDEGNTLFKKHAYNDKKPLKDYWELSLRVVSYADGLPLALKVIGSFLFDKDKKEWMSTLDRLKDIPESEIVEKLKISYDGLKKVEQELFLDIACFFRGISRNDRDAMEILDACGFHPDIGIKVLIQKALISIDSYGRFDMHDLVQEMGHYIVRGEHPNNPEKHSRVWKHEEIKNMCLGGTTMVKENDKTEVIYPDYDIDYSKIVPNMKKLRWLIVWKCSYEAPTSLSNELLYIEWNGYPGSRFPDSFQPTNLAVLKMDKSLQKELWKGWKGKAIENHSMVLLLEGLQIPREFRSRLRDGTRCTVQLPENWCNDFCGFLMCAVIKGSRYVYSNPKITMKQVRGGSMGIDSQDDEVWKESGDDKRTWVGYVSFGSLRHSTTWLDETCKAVSLSITIKSFNDRELCSGFGVSLVPRTSGSGPTDTSLPEYYSELHKKKYDFKPEFEIQDDLTCTFRIPSVI
ncbi:toll/interleukin-1 receptor (TIR) domain-containing protein [Artemisia annua]|uniref:ADP-ribosyl cyclase/cyclic ADP-ribose hydrolase n=1 Tax=Artemisia annua TaxID=35608 RepID=A0A2U1PD46_ARTAN|nr:toll/interleukin-1 receptor (TIR) domain-containing protein [Artemisia annua]